MHTLLSVGDTLSLNIFLPYFTEEYEAMQKQYSVMMFVDMPAQLWQVAGHQT